MSRSCSIALTGLSPTERVLIEGALFPTSGSPIAGAYLEQDLARAQLIIANADDAAAVADLKARPLPGRVLLLGASDRGTGWPFVMRPLQIHTVLEAIRRLLDAPRKSAAGDAEPKAPGADRGWLRRLTSIPAGFADTQPFQRLDSADADDFVATRQIEPTLPAATLETTRPRGAPHWVKNDFQATQQFSHSLPSVTPSDWEAEVAEWEHIQAVRGTGGGQAQKRSDTGSDMPTPSTPAFQEGPTQVASQSAAAGADRILIVGAPGNAADGLIRALQNGGFAVDFAAGAEATFSLLAQRPFHFVILIEVSLGPQAIPLCRSIQGNRGLSPADLRVVIVASHRGLLSRLRAQFAGCSAWLAIPLNQAALIQYLRLNGSHHPRKM